jgi:hypothetical protein
MTKTDAAAAAREMLRMLDDGRGWCKQTYFRRIKDPDTGQLVGQYCLQGALHSLLGVQTWAAVDTRNAIVSILAEQYPERLDPRWLTIPSFNDHEATTWDDVRVVLEKLVAREDA